jgi:hypothetical protein
MCTDSSVGVTACHHLYPTTLAPGSNQFTQSTSTQPSTMQQAATQNLLSPRRFQTQAVLAQDSSAAALPATAAAAVASPAPAMLRRCQCTTGTKRWRSVIVRDGKMYVPSDRYVCGARSRHRPGPTRIRTCADRILFNLEPRVHSVSSCMLLVLLNLPSSLLVAAVQVN